MVQKLSQTQRELLQHCSQSALRAGAESRYEMRVAWGGMAHVYDRDMMCWDDWPIRRTTINVLERHGYIEQVGRDTVSASLRYALTEKGKTEIGK